MTVFRGLENVPATEGSLLTVGSFDGLHLGHQRILRQMRKYRDGMVTVLTFDPHPQTVVRPDFPPPPQLTTFDERQKLFERHGVERLVLARFDLEFAALEAEEYVRSVLCDRLHVKRLFVGPNHHFGKGRRGDVNLLHSMATECGFTVEVIEPVHRKGEIVSSSRIRKKLLAGDALNGMRCLSRPYYITGLVVHGAGKGRKLGFPTANFQDWESGKLEPPPGIYATITELDGIRYPSVSHFGPRPTFAGLAPAIETHLIGFDADIYGRMIRVGLVDKIRDTFAFGSVEELIRQMDIDRQSALDAIEAAGFGTGARIKDRRLGLFTE